MNSLLLGFITLALSIVLSDSTNIPVSFQQKILAVNATLEQVLRNNPQKIDDYLNQLQEFKEKYKGNTKLEIIFKKFEVTAEKIKKYYQFYKDNKNIDFKTFHELDYGLYEDKNSVYNSISDDPGSLNTLSKNPKSFEIINSKYFVDKNSVFLTNGRERNVFRNVENPKNITILDFDIIKDDKNVYYGGRIENQDYINTKYLTGFSWYRFGDGKNIYYREIAVDRSDIDLISVNFTTYHLVKKENIDYDSFKLLGYYAIDKNHVYSGGEILTGLSLSEFKRFNENYIKKGNKIFFKDEEISGINADKFEIFNEDWGRDDKYIVCAWEIVGKISNDFKYFGNGYYKEKNNIYHNNKNAVNYIDNYLMTGVDISTFEVLSDPYTKDKNNIYAYSDKIEGADPHSFEILDDKYAKDKNAVYDYGDKIEGADPESFETLNYGYAKDKNNIYNDGRKLLVSNINNFKLIPGKKRYATDGLFFYKNGTIVK